MNIDQPSPDITVNAQDMKLSARAVSRIRAKASSVARRYPRLLGIQVDLRRDVSRGRMQQIITRIRLILPGYDPIVEKRGSSVLGVVANAMEVAGRQLRRKSRLRKTKQKQFKGVTLLA